MKGNKCNYEFEIRLWKWFSDFEGETECGQRYSFMNVDKDI